MDEEWRLSGSSVRRRNRCRRQAAGFVCTDVTAVACRIRTAICDRFREAEPVVPFFEFSCPGLGIACGFEPNIHVFRFVAQSMVNYAVAFALSWRAKIASTVWREGQDKQVAQAETGFFISREKHTPTRGRYAQRRSGWRTRDATRPRGGPGQCSWARAGASG